jgi:hypothetical protein
MKRKKDAIERCVIGGFPTKQAAIAEDGSKPGDYARGHEAQDDLGARLGPPTGRGTWIYRARLTRRRRLGTGALGVRRGMLYHCFTQALP